MTTVNQINTLLKHLSAYTSYTDEHLLMLLRQSDQLAFKSIYERYWEKLFVTASFRLKDPFKAEEIVQDVMLNLWRKRFDLELKYKLATYLATAVKYEVINRMAKESKDHAGLTSNDILQIPSNNTEEKLSFDELQTRLSLLVKALPEKCRLVFTLSRDQGFSQRQIANYLNISENTVESHIKHALKSLRTGLQHFFMFFF